MADTKAKLTLNGDTAVELDVLKGTLGQDVIDIRTLGSKGVFTLTLDFIQPHPANLELLLLMVMRYFAAPRFPNRSAGDRF
ncbi:hypothetical protein ACVXHB_24435 [Escherichia coli]